MQLSDPIRRSPFSRLLVFFMAGIVTPILTGVAFKIVLLVVLIVFFLIILLLLCRKNNYQTGFRCGIVTAVILFLSGTACTEIRLNIADNTRNEAVFKGYAIVDIKDPVSITATTVKTTGMIKFRLINGKLLKSRQHVLLGIAKDSLALKLEPGCRLFCYLKLSNIKDAANPDEFNYRKYLASRGIYNQAYLSRCQWKKFANPHVISMSSMAFRMQKRLLAQYEKIRLTPTSYSILSAITLGYKSELEATTKQAFAGAGVMHIMALSGFNVAVIALVLGYVMFFTSWIKAGKKIKTIVIIATVWMFAFITGLSPSVTRASMMISLVLAGKLLERRINTGNILFISAFLLLAISPMLIRDVSFQLSFAAVLGIILLEPPIYSLIAFNNRLIDKIWRLFTVSCAAQFATLPLTVYYFHQFPVYFWINNLYVIPLVPVIICLSGIFLAFSFCQPVMYVLGKILALLLDFLYKSVSATALLPGSLIENIHISTAEAIILALVIIALSAYFLWKNNLFIFTSLFLMVCFLIFSTVYQLKTKKQQILLVGNVRGVSAIHVISGKKALFLCDDFQKANESSIKYHFSSFRINRGITSRNLITAEPDKMYGCNHSWLGKTKLLHTVAGKTMIAYDNSILKWTTGHRINIDLLVITKHLAPDINALLASVNPAKIVIDSSVSSAKRNYWKRCCLERNIPCHIVQEDGYFLLSAN